MIEIRQRRPVVVSSSTFLCAVPLEVLLVGTVTYVVCVRPFLRGIRDKGCMVRLRLLKAVRYLPNGFFLAVLM